MTKTERRYAKEISQLKKLFTEPGHPRVPTPLPRVFRAAARYLERKKFLVAEDALKRPGSRTVVRGYMIAAALHDGSRTIPT